MSSCTIAPKAGTRPRSSSTPGHRPCATLRTSSRLGVGVVLNQTQLFRRLNWGGVKRSFDAGGRDGESLPATSSCSSCAMRCRSLLGSLVLGHCESVKTPRSVGY